MRLISQFLKSSGFFITFERKNIMADQITPNDPLAEKTRSNIAYLFTLGSIAMLAYILYMWGGKTEILTLIIGLIGGTLLGSVSGVYFGGSSSNKKPDPTVPVTGDSPVINVNNDTAK